MRWCSVIENRPEIVTRRDEGTAMDWFRGKRVALWGCGAIGSLIAEHLARAGVAELTLYDRNHVPRACWFARTFPLRTLTSKGRCTC